MLRVGQTKSQLQYFVNNAAGEDGVDNEEDGTTRNQMHGFSRGDKFEINERCSPYMDRAPITTIDCQEVVKKVYMIEAETLCLGEITMKKPELMVKIFEQYKALRPCLQSLSDSKIWIFGVFPPSVRRRW